MLICCQNSKHKNLALKTQKSKGSFIFYFDDLNVSGKVVNDAAGPVNLPKLLRV